MLVAGSAAAAAALLGGSAYLMGGDPAPLAGGTPASVFLQRDLAVSAPAAVEAGRGPPAGWSLTGEPDFTPAGALTAAQLATLRSEGWTCPELRELGYHLVWARGGVLAGVDIVELRLTDGRNFATILEQHGEPARAVRRAGERAASVPAGAGQCAHGPFRDVGRLHHRDVPAVLRRRGGRSRPGSLWVNHGSPFAAIYQSGDATFTYVSDQPAEQADDGVAALVRAGTAGAGAAAGDGGRGPAPGTTFTARLERGLGRILELLAP